MVMLLVGRSSEFMRNAASAAEIAERRIRCWAISDLTDLNTARTPAT